MWRTSRASHPKEILLFPNLSRLTITASGDDTAVILLDSANGGGAISRNGTDNVVTDYASLTAPPVTLDFGRPQFLFGT